MYYCIVVKMISLCRSATFTNGCEVFASEEFVSIRYEVSTQSN